MSFNTMTKNLEMIHIYNKVWQVYMNDRDQTSIAIPYYSVVMNLKWANIWFHLANKFCRK
jgi:hypothetical protein